MQKWNVRWCERVIYLILLDCKVEFCFKVKTVLLFEYINVDLRLSNLNSYIMTLQFFVSNGIGKQSGK